MPHMVYRTARLVTLFQPDTARSAQLAAAIVARGPPSVAGSWPILVLSDRGSVADRLPALRDGPSMRREGQENCPKLWRASSACCAARD
jgi:hypothetical protein